MAVAVEAGPAVLDAGEAWFEDGAPAVGAVCGVFRQAAYLRFGARILAVCGAGVAPGPLHLRIDPLPALTIGQPARLSHGGLSVGPCTVTVDPEHRWAPRSLDPEALRVATTGDGAPVSPADVGLPPPLLDGARAVLEDGDLVGLARLVGGRGPGLTPAGDDLLAGALVAHAALHPEAVDVRRQAACAAATTDLAAAFLRWAAAGRCIRPVHHVLGAVADGSPDRLAAARSELRRIGASSGTALLLGLELGLWHEA